MPPKAPKPGAEVDAYCTKCRMDLTHRVISLDGDKIAKVECRTCMGHHNFRRPKSAPAERVARAARAAKTGAVTPKRTSPGTARQQAERERERTWERSIAGHTVNSFRPYRPTATFELGELIRHTKFGDGYVLRILDHKKVEAMFRDGTRMLAQALDG